jgi:hypothetical protein
MAILVARQHPRGATLTDQAIQSFYHAAKRTVEAAGFGFEGEWQRGVLGQDFLERDLLREAAWVILCSGFNERVVRRRFDAISLCFCDWCSAEYIVSRGDRCRSTAMAVFGNSRKITAILRTCDYVYEQGFSSLCSRIQSDPIQELGKLPFIGPVTSYHLAKNLGIDVVKRDRHLVRLAAYLGFDAPEEMCVAFGHQVGEPVSVVDIVLWRYCALSSLGALQTADRVRARTIEAS